MCHNLAKWYITPSLTKEIHYNITFIVNLIYVMKENQEYLPSKIQLIRITLLSHLPNCHLPESIKAIHKNNFSVSEFT